jgi:hypothetical protein
LSHTNQLNQVTVHNTKKIYHWVSKILTGMDVIILRFTIKEVYTQWSGHIGPGHFNWSKIFLLNKRGRKKEKTSKEKKEVRGGSPRLLLSVKVIHSNRPLDNAKMSCQRQSS